MTIRFFHALALLWLASACHVFAQNDADELGLNGIAVHTQLRQEVYVGALYAEVVSSHATMLLNSDQNKRMEIRVLAERWSERRFLDHWNEALLINNSEQDLKKFAREIRRFTGAIKGTLISGDKVIIDYAVNQQTRLIVDGVQLLSVTNEPGKFFELLLRCWIGPRPPSTDFKNAVLNLPTGAAADGIMARYQALLPVHGRSKTIAAWRDDNQQVNPIAVSENVSTPEALRPVQPQSQAEELETTAAVAATSAQHPPAATPLPGPADRVTAVAETSSRVSQVAQSPGSSNIAATQATATVAETVTVDPGSVTSESAQAREAALATREISPAGDVIMEQNAKATAPADLDAAEDGLLSLYKSNLLKRVYGFVIYPERAIDRNQEGTVVLQVTVNRRGKVLNIRNDEPSRYRLLNSAATRAIKKASPFPAAPKKLKGKQFDLEFPIIFRIPRS